MTDVLGYPAGQNRPLELELQVVVMCWELTLGPKYFGVSILNSNKYFEPDEPSFQPFLLLF